MMENGYVMNVDARALEQQDENFRKPLENRVNFNFDPKNYLNLKLKPNESTKTVRVRLLPTSPTDGNVFFAVKTHSMKVSTDVAKSGFKSFICLNDEHVNGESCPICNKSAELLAKANEARKEGNDALSKTYYKESCSLKSKRTYIVRVIDRDNEDEGVKFWRFNENSLGEGVYDKLMNLYKTRKKEYADANMGDYNIFDLYRGRDINININKSMIPDGHGGMKEKLALNITDSSLETPLSNDVNKANEWINDPKTWKDVYSNKSADYLQLIVEGKVPFYNRETGKYVEKIIIDAAAKKAEEEAATEILTQNSGNTAETVSIIDDNDLPF